MEKQAFQVLLAFWKEHPDAKIAHTKIDQFFFGMNVKRQNISVEEILWRQNFRIEFCSKMSQISIPYPKWYSKEFNVLIWKIDGF